MEICHVEFESRKTRGKKLWNPTRSILDPVLRSWDNINFFLGSITLCLGRVWRKKGFEEERGGKNAEERNGRERRFTWKSNTWRNAGGGREGGGGGANGWAAGWGENRKGKEKAWVGRLREVNGLIGARRIRRKDKTRSWDKRNSDSNSAPA